MRIVTCVAFLVVGVSFARSEIPPPPDGLSTAYEKAGRELAKGADCKAVLDALKEAIEKHPRSQYQAEAKQLALDLTYLVENPPKLDGPPEARLAETRLPFHLIGYSDNWDGALKPHRDGKSNDPIAQLLIADRKVIGRLLPLLKNDSPTRAYQSDLVSRGGLPQVPRVCDFALAVIEFHSLCRFYDNASSGTPFHQLPEPDRARVTQRIAIWWKENENDSLSAGIRDQLPFADFYARVWMAKNLIRLGDRGNKDDREYGLDVLRKMVKESAPTHLSSYAANVLAEFGDLSPLEIFSEVWKSTLGQPGVMRDSGIAFYLVAHGGRREWELLSAIAEEDTQNGRDAGSGAVWAAIVNSTGPRTSPYVIPILGLVLQQKHTSGSRSVAGTDEIQSFSYADKAAELLQQKTGLDFGYKPPAKLPERNAAIDKAQKWWTSEGKAKYNFDFIEAELVKKAKK